MEVAKRALTGSSRSFFDAPLRRYAAPNENESLSERVLSGWYSRKPVVRLCLRLTMSGMPQERNTSRAKAMATRMQGVHARLLHRFDRIGLAITTNIPNPWEANGTRFVSDSWSHDRYFFSLGIEQRFIVMCYLLTGDSVYSIEEQFRTLNCLIQRLDFIIDFLCQREWKILRGTNQRK